MRDLVNLFLEHPIACIVLGVGFCFIIEEIGTQVAKVVKAAKSQ